jgi:hypothetical protein
MICPKCKEMSLNSTILVGYTIKTLMGNISSNDEKGNFHYHDTNISTTRCECSNGHKLEVKNSVSCPSYPNNCDYHKDSVIKVIEN